MPMPTLLDIAKANGNDAVVGLIDETTKAHPELSVLPARTIKGLNYKTLIRVALGRTTGSFRDANSGTSAIKNTYENRTVETFTSEPRMVADKAVADRYEDGAQAYIALEAEGVLEGEMQAMCTQFYYGRNNTAVAGNASGFPGLIDSYDSVNMVVDAGGTTDNTATSVWFARYGPRDLTWVWGQDGEGFKAMPAVRRESVLDPNDSTKSFDAYVMSFLMYPGLQVGSLQSLVRIKKLTADAGKGMTDTLVNMALEKFPPGKGPNVVFMTQRSLRQLQSSRTATTATGAPAPWPTALVGVDGQEVPIKVTDAIKNTETLAL